MTTEEQFLQFADLRPAALLLVTGGGVVLAANRAVEARLGLLPAGCRGRPLADLVTDTPENVADYLRACSRSRDLVFGSLTLRGQGDRPELPCRSEGCVYQPKTAAAEAIVLLCLVPHEAASARFVALTQQIDALSREIAHRKRVEEELLEATRRKDQFLSMLAHELRGPLAPLLNSVHLLRQAGGDPTTRERVVEMLGRQSRHLARLVDGLLEATRLVRGQVKLRRERLDLARLVRAAAADFRPVLEQAGLPFTVQTPQTPVWVLGDETRLTQVLSNLLDNAVKFSARGGEVVLRLSVDGAARQAVVTVRDHGIGIEAHDLPHLFQVFAQADRSLDRSRGGLGLGLFVVRGMVELHGGRAEAVSAGSGQGTEVTVRLPLAGEPAALAEASPPGGRRRRRRLLVIEDHRDSTESLRLLLEMLGHEVRLAFTGPEGVQAAAAWLPEVVISDIGLPELDGYGVAAELRKNPATAGVLLIGVSGYGRDEDRQRAHDAGFDHYLVKPAAPEELQQLLVGPG